MKVSPQGINDKTMSNQEEGLLVVIGCLAVVHFTIVLWLFYKVINLIKQNEHEIFRLDVLIESIIEIFNNKYKINDDGEAQE